MNKVEQGFRTPDLDGKAFKENDTWRTTTSLPTVRNARIVDPPEYLKPGLSIQFDLLTQIEDGGNVYLAVDVKRFERSTGQKLKPKQRDKMKRRKI
jgi:hypothetical protein